MATESKISRASVAIVNFESTYRLNQFTEQKLGFYIYLNCREVAVLQQRYVDINKLIAEICIPLEM